MSFGKKQPTQLSTINLLDIREVQTKNGKAMKVQFGKDVEISFQGKKIDLGEYNSIFLQDRSQIEEGLSYKVDKGWITEDKAGEEVDRIEKKGIQYIAKAKLS